MSFKVIPADNFSNEIKKLYKKYPDIKRVIGELGESLAQNPRQGQPLGHGCYKLRLTSRDKPKGKRGGFRVIIFIYFKKEYVFLLSIYDKSKAPSIKDKVIKELIRECISKHFESD